MIDYLKIDIEGWEFRILDDYSWKIKPDILKVEYKHWQSSTIKDHKNPKRFLRWNYKVPVDMYIQKFEGMGYSVTKEEVDLIAVLNE